MKETILEIGTDIQRRNSDESKYGLNNKAIARYQCIVSTNSILIPEGSRVKHGPIWLVNKEILDTRSREIVNKLSGQTVYKNTALGGALISGKSSYFVKNSLRRVSDMNIDLFNSAFYNNLSNQIKDITIVLSNGSKYSYSSLNNLLIDRANMQEMLDSERKKAEEDKLNQAKCEAVAEETRKIREEAERLEKESQENLRKAEEEYKRKEAERKAEEARKVAEEACRKEEEQRRQAEEVRKRTERIKELEEKISKSNEIINSAYSFVRDNVSLRSQHILDVSQETAKRSNLFNGTPILIEGGPGTGKTTTMIQRLKFLLSKSALEDCETPLNQVQIDKLTDLSRVNSNWLFFSPTDQLLRYLRKNMHEEDLNASESNTTTLSTLDSVLMIDYKLWNPEKNGPFKYAKRLSVGEETMILNPQQVVKSFEQFCIHETTKNMLTACKLNTAEFPWHQLAIKIKAACKDAESIKDMNTLIRLINTLQDHYIKDVSDIEKQLGDEIKHVAIVVQSKIEQNNDLVQSLTNLFQKWKDESIQVTDDEDDEVIETSITIDFPAELFKNLKSLVKKLALKKIDSKIKLSKRQCEIYDNISLTFDDIDLSKVSTLAWFTKNYARLCKGLESAILNPTTKYYKQFRKLEIDKNSDIYNKPLLEKYVKKENKILHPDELHLIVGFINRLLLCIYKGSRIRFEKLANHKYAEAYRKHVKYVIGIDEATDYSWLDYYLITSLCHYEFSSLTLCGDAMQGLNSKGVDWDILKETLLPKLEKVELKVSYRQTSVLVDMAKKMYKDSMGIDAPYTSNNSFHNTDATPLAFVSDDEEEKAQWIVERVVEVFKKFGDAMPTVAIFVSDVENIPKLKEILEGQDLLNSIDVFDCSDNRESPISKCIRIFRMREVKGMEFEVAFFHNIDTALTGEQIELMRRYLYVGISRATSHLAATFTSNEGNEDILKYFDKNKRNWKV